MSVTIALYTVSAATLRGANPRSVTAAYTGGYLKMENNQICPLLTTNTVVEEDGTVRIGTQPVFCLKEQCAWWVEDRQKCAIMTAGAKGR